MAEGWSWGGAKPREEGPTAGGGAKSKKLGKARVGEWSAKADPQEQRSGKAPKPKNEGQSWVWLSYLSIY